MHSLVKVSQALLVICLSLGTFQQESSVYHITRGIDTGEESYRKVTGNIASKYIYNYIINI